MSVAQLKSTQPSPYRNTGNVIKMEQSQPTGGLGNLFNMRMSHSYEMSFMSGNGFSGNVNMYTNTMMFAFSPKMTGRLDLAFAHSPFGNSMQGMQGMNQNQFFIRNASLNYKISENAQFNISFQQLPYGPMGMGLNNGFYGFERGMWPN